MIAVRVVLDIMNLHLCNMLVGISPDGTQQVGKLSTQVELADTLQ